jgi:hypothetical protein
MAFWNCEKYKFASHCYDLWWSSKYSILSYIYTHIYDKIEYFSTSSQVIAMTCQFVFIYI